MQLGVSVVYFITLDVSSRNTLDVDVSSRTHVLSNQEINRARLHHCLLTYSTIIVFNIISVLFNAMKFNHEVDI